MAEQRYKVLKKLDAGGMAEVFLGEAESLHGFKKQVAIKRVLPHLAQNRKFIAMFLDEARLSLHLTHANIVHVFDIGVADNTYFIVMEYVDGCNLKTILDNIQRSNNSISVAQGVYILIEVLKALSYAHELTEPDGQPLNIVHRDVSPPNVLISKRGEVKLVDFGLAKAVGQLEQTDPGIVKGKFSYLSPEAASGLDVDSRADIFAAGILLYEMLTGQKLFLGETDIHTVELVRRADIPDIKRYNPQVPPALEQVVHRALAVDLNQRYTTAREFGDALAHVLFAHNLKVTNFDIGSLVTQILSEESVNVPEPSIIDRLIQEELLRFTSLDELEEQLEQGFDPLQLQDVGAAPLDGGAFEDPRQWADELLPDSEASSQTAALLAAAAGQAHPPLQGQSNVPPVAPPTTPKPPPPGQPLSGPQQGQPQQGQPQQGQPPAREPAPPPPKPSGSKGLKVALIVLILALLGVGGVIAFLLTR